MYKSIRRFLCFLLVLQLIIPYSTFAAAVGRFTSVVGDVTQTRVKRVIKPVARSPIQMKDLIATALTSSATMVFSDDSTIKLSENTKLEIKEFLFKDKSRRGIFSLAVGKMTADVKKYIGGDNVFEVQSPTAVVGVRGTGFEYDEAVNAQNQGVATVACTEGSLNLSALSATREVVSTAVLEAGQVAVIIGGVITISAIGAAAAAAASQATETGTAGASGGAGTGGAAAGGGAAAATGLSTAAIAGIAIGGAVVIGGAAALAGGGGGGSSSSSSSTLDTNITTQTLAATWGITGTRPASGSTTSGTIVMSPAGTYTYSLTTIHPGSSPSTGTGTGRWSLTGSSLTLTFDAGAVYNGTAQGNSTNFSMVCSNGWTLNFSRR